MNLRRCSTCKHHLERWGSRLYCMNAQCPGSPIRDNEPAASVPPTGQIAGQLRLPGTEYHETHAP
jgi:hypothetical protein